MLLFKLKKNFALLCRSFHATPKSFDLFSFNLNKYRSLINVKGPDASTFLQSLVTNDVKRLSWPNNPIQFAMILNSRGRVLFDILIYNLNQPSNLKLLKSNQQQQQHEDPNYLLEVDYEYRERALKMLRLFKVKKQIEIREVGESEFEHVAIWSNQEEEERAKVEERKEFFILHDDPRWMRIGQRYLAKRCADSRIESTNGKSIRQVDRRDYKKHLYSCGVPENNDDYKFENCIPLEYNLVFMNGGK